MYSSTVAVEQMLPSVDLVIGAVLVHGARAPRVMTREQLHLMKPGTVLVDVAIDQGGCFETSQPTTHTNPTYEVDGIPHYCVANMPGAVPITATYALTNSTLPYVLTLADLGVKAASRAIRASARGINVAGGQVTTAPSPIASASRWRPSPTRSAVRRSSPDKPLHERKPPGDRRRTPPRSRTSSTARPAGAENGAEPS